METKLKDDSWLKLRRGVLELMRHAIRLGDFEYARELRDLSQKLKARISQ